MRGFWLAGLGCAVLALGACGGGGGGDKGSAKRAAKPNTPPVKQVVAVSRHNPGLAKCKKVSYGLLDNTPETPREPLEILSITCDGATVGLWLRYRDEQARAASESLEHRPYFVNANVKVSTGEAILAHIDANAWKTMPSELKRACNCGEVRQPTK
jgi:hypothetical protein